MHDGQLPDGARRDASRRDASRWDDDCAPDAVRDALRRPVDLGPAARARLASALAAEARPRPATRLGRAARWFVRPVRLPLPPLAMGAAAAALVIAGVLAGERLARHDAVVARAGASAGTRAGTRAGTPASAPTRAMSDTVRLVRFVLVAPRAGRVALVGDFNAWDAARTPMRPGADGRVWTVELPVSAGRHLYAFVVDGTRWVVDPAAPLAPEEDFGTRNSVLVVGAET